MVALTAKGRWLPDEIERRSNQRVLALVRHLDPDAIDRLLDAMDTIRVLITKQDTMTSPIRHFPPEIEALPAFEGPFDAHRLQAEGCEVLFATYPAGTTIAPHTHRPTTSGWSLRDGSSSRSVRTSLSPRSGDWYHVPADTEHAARFDTDRAEIKFWFGR